MSADRLRPVRAQVEICCVLPEEDLLRPIVIGVAHSPHPYFCAALHMKWERSPPRSGLAPGGLGEWRCVPLPDSRTAAVVRLGLNRSTVRNRQIGRSCGNSCRMLRDNPDGLGQRATYGRCTPGQVAIIADACRDEAFCGVHKYFGVPKRIRSVVPERAVRADTPTHRAIAAERRRVQHCPGLRLKKRVPVAMCGEVAK